MIDLLQFRSLFLNLFAKALFASFGLLHVDYNKFSNDLIKNILFLGKEMFSLQDLNYK